MEMVLEALYLATATRSIEFLLTLDEHCRGEKTILKFSEQEKPLEQLVAE